ncbi:MAG: NAD(P)-dependent alcohol dehydrogenase [Gammaproteobacteria bacterium]|nr:NAD(P)-dependent alcohol dehydrogenase [Gammaproteobacteria bacterium]
MRALIVPTGCSGIDELRIEQRPEPKPGPLQVLLRVRAVSLNYRDQAVVTGNYFGGKASRDMILLSDGAGEVLAVGDGVTRWRPGDRVMPIFSQVPPAGSPGAPALPLGSPLDGMGAEQVVCYEDGLVAIPEHLSFEEAACLPCAAVTAWHALMCAGRPVIPGDVVLVLGSGGVSVFALQLARAAGAQVIATSSSDDKLTRLTALGAAAGINYRTTPDWDAEVMRLTGNHGADCIVEVGGAGTLARSFRSLAHGGKIGLIGVLTGPAGDTNPHAIMLKGGTLHGIFVGNREMFERLNRAISVNRIRPVIDRVYEFDQAHAAFRQHVSGNFIGKVVIRL